VPKPAATFQDLHVWRKAHTLVLHIYETTATFPKHEMFGLTSQMRRAGISVPSNIAEGFRRRSRWDKARFLNIAASSLDELQYQLILARDLRYCDSQPLLDDAAEVSRMLSAYERTILASARMSNLRTVFLTSIFYLLYSVS
jgi:four helix bundle protein